MRGLRAYAWCGWLGVVACIMLLSPPLGEAGREFAYAGVGLGSAMCVLAGIRLRRAARPRAWLLLAAGLSCGGAANAIWAVELSLRSAPPRFSVVDVLYFAMYPLLAAGLAALPERSPEGSRWIGVSEAGIAACTSATLGWLFVYDPYVLDRPEAVVSANAFAYPILDVLLVAVAVRLLVAARRLRPAHVALVAMTLLMIVADASYVVSVVVGGAWSGSPCSSLCWLAAFALPGVAALHPAVSGRGASISVRAGGWHATALQAVLVLIGPAATGYALILDSREGHLTVYDFIVPVAATVVISLLLVVRMGNGQRQLQRHAEKLGTALAEQAALQRSLRHVNEHDALTGLPNRRRLQNLITSGTPYGLLLLDLDGFQNVNDRLGHSAGDDLLRVIADRLGAGLADADVLARTGGDEFAVLVPGAAPATVTARAEALLATLREPVTIHGHVLYVTASIGVRLPEPTADPAHLLDDADLALYAAKAAGKDCAVWYDAGLRDRQTERLRTVERLRGALRNDELAVFYQPIVDLLSSRTVAAEALVRWLPPGEDPIGPDLFIPAAEDSGLIVPLGEWVLRRACADAVDWHRRDGITIAVNVSPRQLHDPEFTAKVRRCLAETGLPAGALTLEITEGILVGGGTQKSQALAHLDALRGDGVRIAIDDFGTGYSSLAYLRDLPIDVLKIDRSLMPSDDTDTRRTALVRAVVDLARGLELTTVAEGVETAFQAGLLVGLGCERGQGYHFARPMPGTAFSPRQEPVPQAG
ncbi:Protein gmr [Actinoplanes sp. SE50]|uniref:putative bifunctional diguanylate cyclase/phosphodiesterase n=1 Tax=unclassified Actinoplanes TaxID=2626549 RepID=UPI00023EBD7E|nr:MULTISPECIES: bifunctional diguanylate cyclase/phosphodiesterase [unclassified Actinoplanes]AEV85712.1 Protein gmr [Actinoplanes sp. SE50/110]ATO84105.1 Protein gmr [Actinoplanes sp. SE50]SLM01515.1 Protein gmr [Actinoplanes sp. SE50/110]